jgi:heme exporter protein D
MLDLDAGRYAAFVWPAYAVSAAVVAAMVADTLLRARRWRRRAQALEAETRRQDDTGQ